MSNFDLAGAAEAAVAREDRLRRLEDDVKKLQPNAKDGWDRFQALLPLITGVFLAVVGYFLTGSVNNAIQRQQLQLSNVKEMREILAQLDTADASQADSAAFTLAAFGRPAVSPLMSALVSGGEVRAPAAERALRMVGLSDREPVCHLAQGVLDNRSGRFSWLAHLSVVRLLGDLRCVEARASVSSYARQLDAIRTAADLTVFAVTVDADPAPDMASITQLRDEVMRTARTLNP